MNSHRSRYRKPTHRIRGWRLSLCLPAAFSVICVLAVSTQRVVGQAGSAGDEKPPTRQDFERQSVALRTALHHDPTLDTPLERLIAMYRGENRVEELLGIYRAHLAQYPSDAGGTTVLVRLLVATGDSEVTRAAGAAAERFPQNAYLHFLHYQALRARSDPKALDALDRAIGLETQVARRSAWVDLLLPIAVAEDRRAVAKKHLVLLSSQVSEPDGRLEVARKMSKYQFYEEALELLEKAIAAALPSETMVALEMEAASAEVGLNRMEAAAARLERLLARLASDYWQREEILRRRLSLVKSPAQQEAMIQAARKRVEKAPGDEAALLDLARILSGFELPREALVCLQDAARRGVSSARIEKQILELFDRLHDEAGREAYLARRAGQEPDRRDLAILHVKSLYALDRGEEALAELTATLAKLEPQDRPVQLLEMGRWLRRASLPAKAAELYRRVIDMEPARLDVRRELAEVYLATGQRERVRELFSKTEYLKAEAEHFLDLVQFMIQQELLPEAKAAVAERLARDKDDLELRLLLLSIQQRLGKTGDGDELLLAARRLSDTGARYRRWLEAAAAFAETMEIQDRFFQAEQERLDREPRPWTPQRLERRLAYAEVASRSGRRAEVLAMLKADLAANPPAEMQIRLRRQLVAVLDSTPVVLRAATPGAPDQDRQEMLAQLEKLAQDDPQWADEANARRALLHARAERADLASQLLAKIDVARIHDPAILNALRTVYPQYRGDSRAVLAILERLTVVTPADRSAWEQWVAALAAQGDEARLAGVLRRLLAGVPNMPLSDSTRQLLQAHLADSLWRSVSVRVIEGQEAALADALPLLESVERVAQDDVQRLWIAWVRAYVLNRLRRVAARDATIAELERQVALLQKASKPEVDRRTEPESSPETEPAGGLRIAFPEGLSVSLEQARGLLTQASSTSVVPAIGPSQGPAGQLQTQWAFETSSAAAIVSILPVADRRVLIGDASRSLTCLDAASGRVLWQRDEVLPSVPPPQQRDSSYPPSYDPGVGLQRKGLELLADDQGRFYVPGIAEVSCYALEDGRLLWRARVGVVAGPPQSSTTSPPTAATFLAQGRLVAYEPASGIITKIDPATGKIVWELGVSPVQPAIVGPHNSGASLSGNRLLVYGARTAIVDLERGEIQWSFEPWRVRPFPLKLTDPATPAPLSGAGGATTYSVPAASMPVMGAAGPLVTYGPSYPRPFYSGRYARVRSYPSSSPYGPSQPMTFVDYSQPGRGGLPSGAMCLSGPAVVWAALDRQGTPRQAALVGPWALLWDPGGMYLVRTDLPLGGTRVAVQGMLIGVAGRTACLLDSGQLQLVDLPGGAIRRCGLQEFAGPEPVSMGAAVDGPLVYLSDGRSISVVNVRTAQRVFQADWPKDATLPAPAPGSSSPAAGPPGGLSALQPTPYGSPSGMSDPFGRPAGPRRVLKVGPGRIYAASSPSRVVALKERGADGR